MKALFPVSIKQAEEQKNRKQKEPETGTRESLEKNRSAAGMYVLFFPVSCSILFQSVFLPDPVPRRGSFFIDQNKRNRNEKESNTDAETVPRYFIQVQKKQNRGGVYLFSYTYIFLHSIIFIHLYIFIPIQEMIFLLSFCDLSLALFFQRVYIMYVK